MAVVPVMDAPPHRSWRRTLMVMLPLLCAAIMLVLGLWLRWPTMHYRYLPRQKEFNEYAFSHFSYSDIASLFYRDKLRPHPRPYFDYKFEYPVGTGLLVYLLNFASPMPRYFLTSSLFLAVCGLATMVTLQRFPQGKPWLLALSPALALYVNLNWDMWAVLLMLIALLLIERERATLGGVLLATAVWTKFFPIVMLPLVVLAWLRAGRRQAALRLSAAFTVATIVINAPLLVLRPQAWLYFFEVNRTRPRELNGWNLIESWGLTTAQINFWSAALLVVSLVVIMALVWRGNRDALLAACTAATALFFFVNKVYSPQYSLWIAVLLAATGAAPALAVAWSATDLLYFLCSFIIFGIGPFPGAGDWFYHFALFPAMILREGMLLVVAGWCLWRMRAGYTTAG
jgi:hypothetical protein